MNIMISDDEDDIPLNAVQAQLTNHHTNHYSHMDTGYHNSIQATDNHHMGDEHDDEDEDVEILPNARRVQHTADNTYADNDEDDYNAQDSPVESESDDDGVVEGEDEDEYEDVNENDEDSPENQNPVVNNHTSHEYDDSDDDDDDDDDDIPLSAQLEKMNKNLNTSTREADDASDDILANEEKNQWLSEDDVPFSELLPKIIAEYKKPKAKRRRTSSGKRGTAKRGETNRKKKSASKTKVEDEIARKFDKPGQRRETPPDNDPSRLFYESMYKEKLQLGKKNVLAETWMLRHGLLDDKLAAKVYQRLKAK